MQDDLFVDQGLVLPAKTLTWTAVRSSGPGGQNVNKLATKVELRFDFSDLGSLSPSAKARLRRLAGRRLDPEGRVVLVCQTGRTQAANLRLVRERLAALVREALIVPKKRRPTRPGRAATERRLADKRARSKKKLERSGHVD